MVSLLRLEVRLLLVAEVALRPEMVFICCFSSDMFDLTSAFVVEVAVVMGSSRSTGSDSPPAKEVLPKLLLLAAELEATLEALEDEVDSLDWRVALGLDIGLRLFMLLLNPFRFGVEAGVGEGEDTLEPPLEFLYLEATLGLQLGKG